MPRPTPKGRKTGRKVKSSKADGTPKKRWTAAERAVQGRPPRRAGARPRSERQGEFDGARRREDNRYSTDERTTDRGGRRFADYRSQDAGRDDGPRWEDRPRRDDRWSDDRPKRSRWNGDKSSSKRSESPGGRGQNDRSAGRPDGDDRRRDDRPRDDLRTGPRRRDDWRGDGRRRDDVRSHSPRGDDRRRADSRPDASGSDEFRDSSRERGGERSHPARAPRHENWGPRYERGDRFTHDEHRDSRRYASRGAERPDSGDMMSWESGDLGDIDTSGVDVAEGFGALGVPAVLVAALERGGITQPFPIQAATIPDAMSGRDVLGRGRTGSGKTLGFGLPMLTRIAAAESAGGAVRGLVLVPTRELALQVADVLSPLARAMGQSLTLVAGGMAYGPQLRAFERGVDVVVATPGRLIDLMEQGAVDLSQVLTTVLDEADHMADLGFMPAVTTVLDAVPSDGQRLLFSATLDGAVHTLVKRYLHDPLTREVDANRASVTTMEHQLLHCAPHDKNPVTAQVANRGGRTLVFVRTQMGANRVSEQLRAAGVMAGPLHGGLTQGARTRTLSAFKEGSVPVLVATDVAARGIHVDDISLVLQVDPPMNSKDYLHRAGRTARAGERGVVATIVLPHQRKQVQRLVQQAGVRVEPLLVRPGGEKFIDATGAKPIDSEPIAQGDFEALIAPKRPTRNQYRGGSRQRAGRPDRWGNQGGHGKQGGYGKGGSRRSGGYGPGGDSS